MTKFIRTYEGSIEEVIASGEYDSGDGCLISYDELADLIHQARYFYRVAVGEEGDYNAIIAGLHLYCNRPLHPCLGGKSPYSEFLPI